MVIVVKGDHMATILCLQRWLDEHTIRHMCPPRTCASCKFLPSSCGTCVSSCFFHPGVSSGRAQLRVRVHRGAAATHGGVHRRDQPGWSARRLERMAEVTLANWCLEWLTVVVDVGSKPLMTPLDGPDCWGGFNMV